MSFAVHKLEKFSLNPGKVNLEGFVNLLQYIRDNKTLVLKYYSDMKDACLSDLLRQASINNKNKFTVFSAYSWHDFPDSVRSTRAYNIFYQCEPIYHNTYFTGLVVQSSVESEYNTVCNAGTALAYFRMFIHEQVSKIIF